jgi:transposase
MIAVPAGGRVLVWSSPVDFRKGMDGLCAYVQVTLKADAFAGDLFVFRSRRADRIKVLMAPGCACTTSGWNRAGSAGRR